MYVKYVNVNIYVNINNSHYSTCKGSEVMTVSWHKLAIKQHLIKTFLAKVAVKGHQDIAF